MAQYEYDGLRPFVPDSAWISPSAELIGDVKRGEDVSIWFNSVIRGDNTEITVGNRSNVQDGAILHSDIGFPLKIGEDVTIGHRAILHGCTIGNRVLIGMGATILNNAAIGDDCLVGAGALITEGKEFPANSLIIGSPAKAVRILDKKSICEMILSSADYVKKSK